MIASLLLTGLSALSLVSAGCQEDVACQKLGCAPDVQVVFGNTQITEAKTTPPPYNLDTFPGATSVAQNDVGGGVTSVTWKASEPTTLVVPKSTAANNGQPGTTYFVATSTFEYGGVKYEKPYVTSTTSASFISTIWSTSTTTETKTETTTSIPNPITSWSTTTETTTSIPPPVTSWSTTTSTTTSVTTTTETSTSTITVPTPYCPPPPPCLNRQWKPWTVFTMTKSGSGTFSSINLSVNYDSTASSYFWIADAEFKSEAYAVQLDGGATLGTTSSFVADKAKYCAPTSGDTCISQGYSWGKFVIPPGAHTITISSVNADTGYTSLKGLYKAEEKCD